MHILPEAVLHTSTVRLVDNEVLRHSTGCTIAGLSYLVIQYVSSSKFTIATIKHTYALATLY